MYDLIDCKKQSHDTNSSTEHQLLDQCKTKRTENFFKCCEGHTLNNRRSSTGDELQSFDVFGKHLATSDLFQKYDRKDTCDNPYKFDICDEVTFLTYRITLEHILVINLINVIYVVRDLIRMLAFRITLDPILVINRIKVIYIVECLVRIPCYRHTLEHILVINLIIVMYMVKYLIRILAYRNTLEHIYW